MANEIAYPYQDASLDVEARVADLLSRMTVEDKAGIVFHQMIVPDLDLDNPQWTGLGSLRELVVDKRIRTFNILGSAPTETMVQFVNALQDLAAEQSLQIPILISTDPRHSAIDNMFTSAAGEGLSRWPESPGLAALRDPELVRAFADTVRQEYLAIGIHMALHPQVDIATEPRWSRISGTFGEDPELVAEYAAAYVLGLQGETLGADSVAAMTKHFPGGGPARDGLDPHFSNGRNQDYPGGQFATHLLPFEAAIAAGTSAIMPSYGIPRGIEVDGKPVEEVAMAFNRQMITDLLRDDLGFEGVVCSDWGVVSDAEFMGQTMAARAWGVEELAEVERLARVLNAGCDQIGGESKPALVIEALDRELLTEAVLDRAVARILRQHFQLGLFEGARADLDEARKVAGRADFVAAGIAAQKASITLLKDSGNLPLSEGIKVYAEGMKPEAFDGLAELVDDPSVADVAVLRLQAPFEPGADGFAAMFHHGSLDFHDEEIAHVADISAQVPTVVDIYLERPAIVAPLLPLTSELTGTYGTSDRAYAEVLFGDGKAEGVLPFDLPSSMAAVEASQTDTPFDTKDPLFKAGTSLQGD